VARGGAACIGVVWWQPTLPLLHTPACRDARIPHPTLDTHKHTQIMLLAWPGVVIQFLLIALCAKYVFPYSWSWPQAFLFGSMMSATDPVAVVAVLHEVRARATACAMERERLVCFLSKQAQARRRAGAHAAAPHRLLT
jgi:hypothetical protein